MDNKLILALSWNIATEPKLYWELAPNPYSSRALQIISERFPDYQTADIIRAVALAEPEGKYDRNFKLLGAEQQAEALRNQRIISSEINNRLAHYYTKYEKEFNRIPKDVAYDNFSWVIFGTTDLKEIEQVYAKDQRREFRLLIINLIENNNNSSTNNPIAKKTILQQPLILTIFGIVIFFASFYLVQNQIQSIMQHSEASKQILADETQKEHQSLPMRLKIPKINVDAPVEYMGLTPDGAMDVPDNTIDVGWYKLGPAPGEKGSAVISGHFDGRLGESGVFNHLGKLKQGDKIYVINNLGVTSTFMVRESHTYNPGYAEEVFLSNDNGIHLNLITCDGAWNVTKKSYSKRLVVFTDLSL